MPHGAAPDIVFADLVDADGGHDARVHPEALERVLHRERVHHRGEHPHVVGRHAIHAGAGQSRPAEDVAAAEDHGDLHAHLYDLLQLAGDALEHGGVDTVVAVAQQRLARELHQDSRITRAGGLVHRLLLL